MVKTSIVGALSTKNDQEEDHQRQMGQRLEPDGGIQLAAQSAKSEVEELLGNLHCKNTQGHHCNHITMWSSWLIKDEDLRAKIILYHLNCGFHACGLFTTGKFLTKNCYYFFVIQQIMNYQKSYAIFPDRLVEKHQ